MPELDWWWWWFAAELILVLVAMVAVVWWRGARAVARLASGQPAPIAQTPDASPPRLEAPQLDATEVDAVDSGEAAELRSQLSRSVVEMTGVTDAAREVSNRISADLMSLLQAQAEVQNLATRASGVADLPADAKAALDELLEKLRQADPLLIQAQENLDQVDASLQGMASELGRYGEESGFEWARLRPTTDGLNRLLRLKVDPDGASGGAHRSADVQLPPGLGDAIDQAII